MMAAAGFVIQHYVSWLRVLLCPVASPALSNEGHPAPWALAKARSSCLSSRPSSPPGDVVSAWNCDACAGCAFWRSSAADCQGRLGCMLAFPRLVMPLPAGTMPVLNCRGKIAAGLLFALCGYMELNVWKQAPSHASSPPSGVPFEQDDAKEPGNFGDPAGWSQTGLGGGARSAPKCAQNAAIALQHPGSYNKTMRERELNNGRFAMFFVYKAALGGLTCACCSTLHYT